MVWRLGAFLASNRGKVARATECMERALDIEFEELFELAGYDAPGLPEVPVYLRRLEATGGRPVAVGIEGKRGTRNVPTLVNRATIDWSKPLPKATILPSGCTSSCATVSPVLPAMSTIDLPPVPNVVSSVPSLL